MPKFDVVRDGDRMIVVKRCPPADCSGEVFPVPTAAPVGCNLRRMIEDARDEKAAGWKTPRDRWASGFSLEQ